MFMVIDSNGNINTFDQVNLEGSTATGYWYTDVLDKNGNPKRDIFGRKIREKHCLDDDGKNPKIADGPYTLSYWKHKGSYRDVVLKLDGSFAIPTIGENSNYPGTYTASGIEIHKGGENGWNFSQGCLTVIQSDWNRFISLIPDGKKNTVAGSIVIATI